MTEESLQMYSKSNEGTEYNTGKIHGHKPENLLPSLEISVFAGRQSLLESSEHYTLNSNLLLKG